jgi:hypothetical protein
MPRLLSDAGLVLPNALASDIGLALACAAAGALAGFAAARAIASGQLPRLPAASPPIVDTPMIEQVESEDALPEPAVESPAVESPAREPVGPEIVPLEVEPLLVGNESEQPEVSQADLADENLPEDELCAVIDPDIPPPQILRHGKAVNLLRSQDTADLAMPQLIERFAVALDDFRTGNASQARTYDGNLPQAELAGALRSLIRT